MRFHSQLVTSVLFGALAACGGDIGDDCDDEGDRDECVDEALCAKTKDGDLECMKLCTKQDDCPSTTECKGTPSDLKVCRPK